MIVVTTQTDWTGIMTAIGTVAVAASAVGIAVWSDRRSRQIVREQTRHNDEMFRQGYEQAKQQQRSYQEQQQISESSRVQVSAAHRQPETGFISEPGQRIARPVVAVVNRSMYAISQVDARFSLDGSSIVGCSVTEPDWNVSRLPPELPSDVAGPIGQAYVGVLAPDSAMTFVGDSVLVSQLRSTFAIVRWADRWGTRWEYRQGQVKQVEEGTPWTVSGTAG